MPIFPPFCPNRETFQAAILQKLIFSCKTKSECSKNRKNHRFGKKINKMGQFSIFCQNLMKFHVFANFCMFRTHNRYENYLKCSEFCLHCVCYSLIFNEKPKNCISETLILFQISMSLRGNHWAQMWKIWKFGHIRPKKSV